MAYLESIVLTVPCLATVCICVPGIIRSASLNERRRRGWNYVLLSIRIIPTQNFEDCVILVFLVNNLNTDLMMAI